VKRTLTSTVPAARPPHSPPRPSPPRRVIPAARPVKRVPARRKAAQIVRRSDTSLLDVLDGLLKKGVVLNADIVLALADVDLIYLRLSALLCAADRVFERR
jgi:gas vesicle structural protein